MASQIAPETANTQAPTPTPTFEKWFQSHFTDLEKELSDGPPIVCKDITGRLLSAGINDVGILFSGCNPHGRGENLMTGKPVGFVHMSSVYPYVHADSRHGILAQCEQPCFILPLCQLDSAPALVDMMNEAYSSFVYCIKGGVWHDISYVAYGISLGLAAICHEICTEITITRQNADRLNFLVEAFYCLALSAHSTAKYSPICHGILTMMPYDVSADSLQAMLMTFIFDETPCEAIRVKLLGSAISRYFSENNSLASYADETPDSPSCHLLIAPMLGSLLTMDISTAEIVVQMTSAYNKSMESVFNLIGNANADQFALDRHTLNKHVLCTFAMASPVHFIRPELTDIIYNAVVHGFRDIASTVSIPQHASFVNQICGFTLNSEQSKNSPFLMQIETDQNGRDSYATYSSVDPTNWTAMTLRARAQYIVRYTPLVNLRPDADDEYTSILRFATGTEINGDYWYASVHDSKSSNNVDHTNFFTVTSLRNGITVEHCDKIMLNIHNTDGRYLDPTLCFMNCTVSIQLVKNFCEDQYLQGASDAMNDLDEPEAMESTIESTIESESIREITRGYYNWGQYTASVFNSSR